MVTIAVGTVTETETARSVTLVEKSAWTSSVFAITWVPVGGVSEAEVARAVTLVEKSQWSNAVPAITWVPVGTVTETETAGTITPTEGVTGAGVLLGLGAGLELDTSNGRVRVSV